MDIFQRCLVQYEDVSALSRKSRVWRLISALSGLLWRWFSAVQDSVDMFQRSPGLRGNLQHSQAVLGIRIQRIRIILPDPDP